MGFRMNIPLPGPFSYSVGAPKVGRAVGKAAKAVAKDARQCREARDARPVQQAQPAPRTAPQYGYGPKPVRPAPSPDSAFGGVLLALGLLTLVLLAILGFAGLRF